MHEKAKANYSPIETGEEVKKKWYLKLEPGNQLTEGSIKSKLKASIIDEKINN